jgi:hypothetical protein
MEWGLKIAKTPFYSFQGESGSLLRAFQGHQERRGMGGAYVLSFGITGYLLWLGNRLSD